MLPSDETPIGHTPRSPKLRAQSRGQGTRSGRCPGAGRLAMALAVCVGATAAAAWLGSRPARAAGSEWVGTQSTAVWRVAFRASPDGVGPGGLPCPGCDGVITAGDRSKAAGRPLPPVRITVRSAGGTDRVETSMEPVGNTGSVVYYFAPRPRRRTRSPSRMARTDTDVPGYFLCPNSPSRRRSRRPTSIGIRLLTRAGTSLRSRLAVSPVVRALAPETTCWITSWDPSCPGGPCLPTPVPARERRPPRAAARRRPSRAVQGVVAPMRLPWLAEGSPAQQIAHRQEVLLEDGRVATATGLQFPRVRVAAPCGDDPIGIPCTCERPRRDRRDARIRVRLLPAPNRASSSALRNAADFRPLGASSSDTGLLVSGPRARVAGVRRRPARTRNWGPCSRRSRR